MSKSQLREGMFGIGLFLLLAASVVFITVAIIGRLRPHSAHLYQINLLQTEDAAHLFATTGAPPDVNSSPRSELDSILISWPKEMELSSSDSIILVIEQGLNTPIAASTNSENSPSQANSVKKPGHDSAISTAVAIPTPSPNSSRRGDEIYLTPKLAANNFNVALNSSESQSLSQGKAEWRWNISPKQTGSQIINCSVEFQFLLSSSMKSSDDSTLRKTIWLQELPISIYKYWFTRDSFSIGSLIAGLVGTGLSIPWIYDRFKERREKKSRTAPKINGFVRSKKKNP